MTDTNSAADVQFRILKAMSDEQRLFMAFEMSEFARELTKAGIRREHPEWSERRVLHELGRLAFLPAPVPAWLQAKFREAERDHNP